MKLLAQTQAYGLTPRKWSDTNTTMDKTKRTSEQQDALKAAARIMGSIGGKAGRGESKRRSSDICRAAILKRWEAYRKAKALTPKA